EQVASGASLPLTIGGLPAERDPSGERDDSSQCATFIPTGTLPHTLRAYYARLSQGRQTGESLPKKGLVPHERPLWAGLSRLPVGRKLPRSRHCLSGQAATMTCWRPAATRLSSLASPVTPHQSRATS